MISTRLGGGESSQVRVGFVMVVAVVAIAWKNV